MNRLLTVLLAIPLVSLLTGCQGNLVHVESDFTMRSDWKDFDRVTVRTRNGHVDLRCDAAQTEVSIRGVKKAGGLTIGEANDNLEALEIVAAPDPSDAKNLTIELRFPEELRNKSLGASFDIHVPQGCPAEIQTSNGRIVANGLKGRVRLESSNGRVNAEQIDGDVQIETSNGGVVARQIKGKLRAQSSNGRISIDGVTGDCTLETSNASLEIANVTGSIDAETNNGNVRIDSTPPAEGRVRAVSSNGSIVAWAPATMKGRLDLRTSNGHLTTNLGPATLGSPRWSQNALQADLNGGGQGQLFLHTSNGSITLNCR